MPASASVGEECVGLRRVVVFAAVERSARVLHSVHAFLLFCFAASSVYLLNDVKDRDEDRLHPEKRLRPIASGVISPAIAIATMLLLAIGSLGSAYTINWTFGVLLSGYFLMNVAYTLG